MKISKTRRLCSLKRAELRTCNAGKSSQVFGWGLNKEGSRMGKKVEGVVKNQK